MDKKARIQILDRIVCISQSDNTHRKGMHPTILFPAMGKIGQTQLFNLGMATGLGEGNSNLLLHKCGWGGHIRRPIPDKHHTWIHAQSQLNPHQINAIARAHTHTGYSTKAKEPIIPYYLPQAGERRDGFYLFWLLIPFHMTNVKQSTPSLKDFGCIIMKPLTGLIWIRALVNF